MSSSIKSGKTAFQTSRVGDRDVVGADLLGQVVGQVERCLGHSGGQDGRTGYRSTGIHRQLGGAMDGPAHYRKAEQILAGFQGRGPLNRNYAAPRVQAT